MYVQNMDYECGYNFVQLLKVCALSFRLGQMVSSLLIVSSPETCLSPFLLCLTLRCSYHILWLPTGLILILGKLLLTYFKFYK